MAQWVNSDYLGHMIGTGAVGALGLNNDGDTFDQYELEARATVSAVMQYAGYTAPDSIDRTTVTGAFLAKLCASVLVRDAYGNRKGVMLPPFVQDGLDMLDAVYQKKLPIPGLSPNTRDGYGGLKVASSTVKPARYGRGDLGGF